MDLEKQIGDSLYHMSTGGMPELFRDEEGGFSIRENPMPYLQEPMRQAESKDLGVMGALEEIPFAAGGMVKGAAEGVAGLGGDIEGIIRGITNVLSRGEGEGAGEAFGRGFDEAVLPTPEDVRAGIDQAVMPLVPEDQQALVQEAADVGQMTGLPGAGLAVKGGVKAAKKFRAPTKAKPGVIAFHGSGADFDEFKLDKIGTGVNGTQYGHGLYFSEYEDVATFFRGLASEEGVAGRTYKTELSIDPDNMLDWQMPLKDQPQEIVDKVRSLVDEDLLKTFDYNVGKGVFGGNAYTNYIGKNKQDASQRLSEVGIDGIKYKDVGGSQGYTFENAPTNYVVFKEDAIKILEKYGIAGPVAITALGAATQEGDADAEA